jgi:hypothetical protein
MPPFIARLMAKNNGRLATTPDMMARTGFGHGKIEKISKMTTWEHVTVGDVDRFLAACGLSWSTQRRQRWLIGLAARKGRLHKMHHLKTTNRVEASQIKAHLRRIESLFNHGT